MRVAPKPGTPHPLWQPWLPLDQKALVRAFGVSPPARPALSSLLGAFLEPLSSVSSAISYLRQHSADILDVFVAP